MEVGFGSGEHTFSRAGAVEIVAGGDGGGDVARAVAGAAAGVGARVLAGEEGDGCREGEGEEGERDEGQELVGRGPVSGASGLEIVVRGWMGPGGLPWRKASW